MFETTSPEPSGLKRLALALALLAAFSAVGVCGLLWYFFPSEIFGHASDQALIENFEKHTEDFRALITMFREDSPASVVDTSWMSPDNVITEERWDEYKRLFKKLGLHGGMRTDWRGERCLSFTSSTQGWVVHGSRKGYLYKPEDPSPLYRSLDLMSDDPQVDGAAYRKLNDDWYLFFECCH